MNNFFEMKVLDKDGTIKYIIPADEVQRRHLALVENHPKYFPSVPEAYRKKVTANEKGEIILK
jgi:hypothetical protein